MASSPAEQPPLANGAPDVKAHPDVADGPGRGTVLLMSVAVGLCVAGAVHSHAGWLGVCALGAVLAVALCLVWAASTTRFRKWRRRQTTLRDLWAVASAALMATGLLALIALAIRLAS
ncbi:hypothetical protein ACH347_39020 [Saccharopolyspora sp. 5N102]|uniref:hypothetical protein n=1 Tax=Saccharopolyspora sp. 5N102 TaxID=3375155 RepID=UPI0037AE62F0